MSNESTRFFFVVRLPEEKSHFGALPRFDLDDDLHSGARVKASAKIAGQSFVLHRRRITQRTIASNESGAISGKRSRRWSRSGKSNAVAKFRVVRIAGKKALAL